MDFKWKKIMEAVGLAAALAFAAWLLQHMLEQRYCAARARYRGLIDTLRTSTQGKRREVIRTDIDMCHRRVMLMLHATHIGMAAAILLLLSLIISALDTALKADWLKILGAPGIMFGLVLALPAALFVMLENVLRKKPGNAALAGAVALDSQLQAGGHPQG